MRIDAAGVPGQRLAAEGFRFGEPLLPDEERAESRERLGMAGLPGEGLPVRGLGLLEAVLRGQCAPEAAMGLRRIRGERERSAKFGLGLGVPVQGAQRVGPAGFARPRREAAG